MLTKEQLKEQLAKEVQELQTKETPETYASILSTVESLMQTVNFAEVMAAKERKVVIK